MEQQALGVELREHVARARDVDPVRADGEHPLERLRVGGLDARVGDEPREAQAERVVAVGGRAPVERHDLGAVRGGGAANDSTPTFTRPGVPVEQSSERGHAGTSVAIRVSASAAAALLDAARIGAGVAQRALLAPAVLRVGVGPDDEADDPRRVVARGDLGDHGREVRGRVVGGEVAEDDVEHDHGGARVVARPRGACRGGRPGRSSGAGGRR